jgi:spermidine/putrescine transport system substrate-binding protein
MVAKFVAGFGVKVHIDSYDSMETMIAKLRAGGGGYDIIVPGDATMQVLIAEGMVEKIDVFAMPHFANVDERWREVYWDPKREYSAPWAWGSTAFAVDTSVVTGDHSSLAVLFDPAEEVKGRINMLRDMTDVINMAERYLGVLRCSENPEERKRVLALSETQKEGVRSYDSETKEILVSGEAVVSMSWNGYAMRARDEKPSIA